MTAVSAATAASLARRPVAAFARLGSQSSLLPPPASDFAGLGNVEDGLLVAYADRIKQGAIEVKAAGSRVTEHKAAVAIEQKKMAEARERQQAAERASHGFWAKLKKVATTIAKVASLVASAAAVVCTAGTGAPFAVAVAGLVLSGGGMAVRELKLLGKDSDKIGMGMELCGAAVGLGGALGGAAAGVQVASQTAKIADGVRTGALVVGAAAAGVAGAATVKVAGYERDSGHAAADAEEASAHIAQHQLESRLVIEVLKSAKEAESDALAGTTKAIEACNQATEVAIAGVRG